jgi:hypothetical protein
MKDEQASLGSELARERALTGTGQPSDYDAPPYRQRGFTLSARFLSGAEVTIMSWLSTARTYRFEEQWLRRHSGTLAQPSA